MALTIRESLSVSFVCFVVECIALKNLHRIWLGWLHVFILSFFPRNTFSFKSASSPRSIISTTQFEKAQHSDPRNRFSRCLWLSNDTNWFGNSIKSKSNCLSNHVDSFCHLDLTWTRTQDYFCYDKMESSRGRLDVSTLRTMIRETSPATLQHPPICNNVFCSMCWLLPCFAVSRFVRDSNTRVHD